MVVLVTGGAGFIGSHVAAAFLARGQAVTVLDDLSSGSRANIPNGAQLIEADVSNPEVIETIRAVRPQVIVHAAAQVSVAWSMRDPSFDRRVNLEGTANVADGAARAGAGRLVFLSSGGAIYGESGSANETETPRPVTYYGVHKYAAERYIELSSVPHAIARLANVYGPRQRSDQEGGVVAIFLERVAIGLPLPILGTGQQSRDFVHVEDVVRALTIMSLSKLTGTWNVGTGTATSINALAGIVESEYGIRVGRTRLAARDGDVSRSCLNSDLARVELAWAPTTDLRSGIARTVGPDGAP